MGQILLELFGVENHLSTAQEAARAVLIFCYGLVLLRLSGPRMFGHWSALDIVITIMVGSALARAMTGSAPLVGTMVAAAVMAFLHVGAAHCVARNKKLARIIEGGAVTLIERGCIDNRQRKRSKISEADVCEALREHGIDGIDKLADVKRMTLEPSGNLSIIKADP